MLTFKAEAKLAKTAGCALSMLRLCNFPLFLLLKMAGYMI